MKVQECEMELFVKLVEQFFGVYVDVRIVHVMFETAQNYSPVKIDFDGLLLRLWDNLDGSYDLFCSRNNDRYGLLLKLTLYENGTEPRLRFNDTKSPDGVF